MPANYKRMHHLRTTLMGIAMLLTVISSQSAWSEVGSKSNGDYDDGTLVWSKIGNNLYNHQEAIQFCINKSNTEKLNWTLPTIEQMKKFYQTVKLQGRTNLSGWSWGNTWSSTELLVSGNIVKYEAADLDRGIHQWNDWEDNQRFFAGCITSNGMPSFYESDSKLTWLKINSDYKTWGDTQTYCANQPKLVGQTTTWRLPTVDELLKFAKEAVLKRKDDMLKNGWALNESFVWAGDKAEQQSRLKHAKVYLDEATGPLYVGGDVPDNQDKAYGACVY